MDLNPIVMDSQAARRAFIEYRNAFKEEHAAVDGELMRGYKELSQGRSLIRMTETITAGGADAMGRPRLAIARTDELQVGYRRERNGQVTFAPDNPRNWGRSTARGRAFNFPVGTLPAIPANEPCEDGGNWYATIPLIPPRLRPPVSLANYHVLWEAEWHRPLRSRAARDPALLRHIGGDLWAVVAVWDLSPLEMAVLEMRGHV